MGLIHESLYLHVKFIGFASASASNAQQKISSQGALPMKEKIQQLYIPIQLFALHLLLSYFNALTMKIGENSAQNFKKNTLNCD